MSLNGWAGHYTLVRDMATVGAVVAAIERFPLVDLIDMDIQEGEWDLVFDPHFIAVARSKVRRLIAGTHRRCTGITELQCEGEEMGVKHDLFVDQWRARGWRVVHEWGMFGAPRGANGSTLA
eukprot:gene6991-2226_t